MNRILTASATKTAFYDLLYKVAQGDTEIIVTQNGKPAAALISIQELSQLKETIDILTDTPMMRQIAAGRRYYKSHRKGLSFEDIFGEPLLPPRLRKKPGASL